MRFDCVCVCVFLLLLSVFADGNGKTGTRTDRSGERALTYTDWPIRTGADGN